MGPKTSKNKKKQHVELASIVASYHPLRLAGVRTFEDSAFFVLSIKKKRK